MSVRLRIFAFPVACALTGAASALLTVALAAPASAPPLPEPSDDARSVTAPDTLPEEPVLAIPEGAVECPEADRCAVTRVFLDDLFENPARLTTIARIMPSIKDGVQHGFKFYAIRPESLFKRLGFRNGDLVTAVNGTRLTSLEAAMNTIRDLNQRDAFEVEFQRKGETKLLLLEIR